MKNMGHGQGTGGFDQVRYERLFRMLYRRPSILGAALLGKDRNLLDCRSFNGMNLYDCLESIAGSDLGGDIPDDMEGYISIFNGVRVLTKLMADGCMLKVFLKPDAFPLLCDLDIESYLVQTFGG